MKVELFFSSLHWKYFRSKLTSVRQSRVHLRFRACAVEAKQSIFVMKAWLIVPRVLWFKHVVLERSCVMHFDVNKPTLRLTSCTLLCIRIFWFRSLANPDSLAQFEGGYKGSKHKEHEKELQTGLIAASNNMLLGNLKFLSTACFKRTWFWRDYLRPHSCRRLHMLHTPKVRMLGWAPALTIYT